MNPTMYKARKGGLYWKATKNNMCIDISSPSYKTFILNTSVDLVEAWRLKVEIFEEGEGGMFCPRRYYSREFDFQF